MKSIKRKLTKEQLKKIRGLVEVVKNNAKPQTIYRG